MQIGLTQQTKGMLGRMIRRQEEDFKQSGGVRERMLAARTAARGASWVAGLRDWLAAADGSEELERCLEEARRQVERAGWGVRKRKGWKA